MPPLFWPSRCCPPRFWPKITGDAQPRGQLEQGLSLLEEGTRLLMQAIIAELGPAWAELEEMIDNLNAYYPPEVMPNGDIIIRRKSPLAPDDSPDLEL